MQYLEAEAGR